MTGHRYVLIRLMIGVALATPISAQISAQMSAEFDAIVAHADAARDAGKIDKAVDLYQQALHLKPDWKQGWWVLGSILYDANRFQEGAEAFLPLTALDPYKSAGWAMAGLCEFETGNYKDALPHLQKGVKLGLPAGLYDVAQYHIELILIRIGEFDSALDLIARDTARDTESPKLVEAMGMGALRKPMLPRDIPPADRDLVMAVGRAMSEAAANHGKEATAEFEAILAKYPTVPELHYLDGLVLSPSDPDKALAAFQQELILSPGHVRALITIAAEYAKRNEYGTALTYAQKAADLQPGYFAAHATLGKVLVEGDLDSTRGIKELESAAAIAPGNPQCHLALASAYAKVGRKNDAAAQRAEFLRLRKEIDATNSGPGEQ